MVALAIWLASALFIGLVALYAIGLLLWVIGAVLAALFGGLLELGGLFDTTARAKERQRAQDLAADNARIRELEAWQAEEDAARERLRGFRESGDWRNA